MRPLCREAALNCLRRTVDLRDFDRRLSNRELSGLAVTTYDFRAAAKRAGPEMRR